MTPKDVSNMKRRMEAETFRLDGEEAVSVDRWATANLGGEVIF